MTGQWKFVSNHLLVLVQLINEPGRRQRDISHELGITEASVQRILRDLVEAGHVQKRRVGRRNQYQIVKDAGLRHGLLTHIPVIRVADMFATVESREPERPVRALHKAVASPLRGDRAA